jgi:predicted transglutaminase-like cysteine proteinase
MAGLTEAHALDPMTKLASKRYGKTAAATVEAWRAMIDETRTQPDSIKLRRANDFINERIRFESDLVVWQQTDYWATPLELFGKQAGDCEDFTIAKYATLRAQGIPAEKLRLVYVHARIDAASARPGQAHMVLSYYETPTAEPLILDNLVGEILSAGHRPDLSPIFSFNHEGPREQAPPSPADPTVRLSRWRGVLARMRREGLVLS